MVKETTLSYKSAPLAILYVVTVVTLTGCGDSQLPPEPPQAKEAKADDGTRLTGVVLQKEWTKTMESWNAGGADYFVLDVGDTPVPQQTADEGVLLLPGDTISPESFKPFVGKRVEVHGRFSEGEIFVPTEEDNLSQQPVADGPGQLKRKAGFIVESIELVAE